MEHPENDKCKCGAPGEDSHPCPLEVELGDDYDFECNCCEDCEESCAYDI